ncbi:MAG: hypothetical protein JNM38_07545 [Acidobacteria bacterium]|nr:hypothetical protein [Acidobacteriota bacterium]
MIFRHPLPPWALALAAAAILVLAVLTYRRARAMLPAGRVVVLMALRTSALVALVVLWMHPVRVTPDPAAGAVVAVLVDASRSMAIADGGDGESRFTEARRRAVDDLVPLLRRTLAVEAFGFGQRVQPLEAVTQPADAASSLSSALDAVRTRTAGRALAGIVVVSDGAFTDSREDAARAAQAGRPIVTVPVGSPAPRRDREILDAAIGDAVVGGSTIDVTADVIGRGSVAPFDVRLLRDGVVAEVQRAVPAVDGVPVTLTFRVVPDTNRPVVLTLDVPEEPDDLVPGNARRVVVVPPSTRARQVLIVEGAPGFDHSFLKRTLELDPGVRADAVVRKGANQGGTDAYYVQASPDRAPALVTGFPTSMTTLGQYEAVVLANVALDTMPAAQVDLLTRFVSERGGGLVVLGAETLAPRGSGGAIDPLLPVSIGNVPARPAMRASTPLTPLITPEGQAHPLMRLAGDPGASLRTWGEMPPLAAVAPLGTPHAGATVLAETTVQGGVVRPLVAVQRFGRGRTLVFGGEASWRWKMQRPAGDTAYDTFWRQAFRWVSADALPRIDLHVGRDARGTQVVQADVRDSEFRLTSAAAPTVSVTDANGDTREVAMRTDPQRAGRFVGTLAGSAVGPARLVARVSPAGVAGADVTNDAWLSIEPDDPRELRAPWRDDRTLRSLAARSNGRFVDGDLPGDLADVFRLDAAVAPKIEDDVWHRGGVLAALIALLAAEWFLRRRWGLR